jgi:hypothetical protein
MRIRKSTIYKASAAAIPLIYITFITLVVSYETPEMRGTREWAGGPSHKWIFYAIGAGVAILMLIYVFVFVFRRSVFDRFDRSDEPNERGHR